jgi:hypothetical protein
MHIPYCTIHGFNDDVWQPDILAAMQARTSIKDKMAPEKDFLDYLNDLLKYKYVLSPAGDRQDTYRHWEILALGAIPISNIQPHFRDLFKDSMVFVKDFENLSNINYEAFQPKTELCELSYWRREIQSSQL